MAKNQSVKSLELEERIRRFGWDNLKDLWQKIKDNDTPEWTSGKAFEYLIVRAFEIDGAKVRYPYSVPWNIKTQSGRDLEQLDGAIHYEHLSCLIESKDYKGNVNIEPIAKLRNQLMRRPAGVIGLVFSKQGFTDPARELAKYIAPQTILLWNRIEIDYIFDTQSICKELLTKYHFCIEYGLPDFDIVPLDYNTKIGEK